MTRSVRLLSCLAAAWCTLAATPSLGGVRVREIVTLTPRAATPSRERTTVVARVPLRDLDVARLTATSPWRLRIGSTTFAGLLGDARTLRVRGNGGHAVLGAGDAGRLVLRWSRRRLDARLVWTGAPFFTDPLPSPGAGGLPTRAIGIGLGDARTLYEVPLRVRTRARRVVVAGRSRGSGARWGTVTILSPADGATLHGEPLDVRVHVDGDASPTSLRVHVTREGAVDQRGPSGEGAPGAPEAIELTLLPEATVTRIAHRIAGGHLCAYHVQRKNEEGTRSE